MLRFFCIFLCSSFSLFSLPSQGTVIRGEAVFTPDMNALQIHTQGKAIFEWDQFNIDLHESVSFIQAESNQAILNRVIGSSASQILGRLEANCPIYLINPNGVFIGSSACIETAGFLASTADLSNETFWQGSAMRLQDFGNGSIVNLGEIHTIEGDVFLIARAIENRGDIQAPAGRVTLTTMEMVIHPDKKYPIFIRSKERREGIQNSGTIEALVVELRTESPYEKAIHHTGSIQALSRKEQNGRIYLVAEQGETRIEGGLFAESGEVQILGQEVRVESEAFLDVSGTQGGTLLIGGDTQGKNPEILNAKTTFVGEGAQIRADAISNGDGGKVILWADEKTSFFGKISAEGGKESGNGGFVEISAKSNDWHYGGKVSTLAPLGKSGTLLLDPSNITITNGMIGGSSPAFTNPYNPVPNATLTNGDLQNALASSNVTISTSNGSSGAGIVTFSATVTWSADTQLTVNASRNILVNTGVTVSNTFMGTPTNNPLINFTANTGTPIAADFSGIAITGTISTIDGDISCVARGGTSAANEGIDFSGFGRVLSTGNGSIRLIGTGSTVGTASNKEGIRLLNSSFVEVEDGDLYMEGNGGTGSASQGIEINNTSAIRSQGAGNITLKGVGLSTDSTGEVGVVFADSGVVESLGTGSINIEASGGGNGAGGHGISLTVGHISSVSGTITIVATASPTSTNSANGVNLTGSGKITTQSGLIDITATGGGVGSVGTGLDLAASTNQITSTSGNITIVAQGSPNGTTNTHGVRLINGQISTQSGTINITATGGRATGSGGAPGFGIAGSTAKVEATTTGSIIINGTGGEGTAPTNAGNYGMSIQAGAQVLTNTGSLTCQCSGGDFGTSAWGVHITATNSKIGSTGGTITVTGTGGGAAASNHGIFVTTGGQITNTTGPIILNGTAAPMGTASSSGILVTGTPPASVMTDSGNINITAQGNGNGAGNNGLSITSGGVILTTSGTITVIATASNMTTQNMSPGIFIDGSSSRITTTTGAIDLTGRGGSMSTSSSQGIRITNGGGVTATGTANFIALNGISTAPNEGILVAGSTISSLGGTISLTGNPVGTTNGISVSSGGSVVTNISGPITASSNNRLVIGNNSSVRTLGTGGGDHITVNTVGVSLLGGDDGQALMSTVNGNITITSADVVALTASTAPNSLAQITVGNVANTLTLRSVGLTLTGGSGSGAFAEISTVGGLLSIDGTMMSSGAISLTGGSTTNTYAQIINRTNIPAGDAISIGSTTPPITLTLQGGLAAGGAPAYIMSDVGGNIVCNTSGDWTITGGSSGSDASAGIITGFSSGSGDITTTSAGAISITGGSGTGTNYAGLFTGLGGGSGDISIDATSISLTGGSNTGANYANIATSSGGGSITVVTSGGPNILQGGIGDVADAQIITNGAGNINFTGVGDFSALGGTGASSSADVNAQGTLTINIGAGDYLLRGDAGDSSFARFTATGAVDLTGGDYTLTGGASGTPDGSNAVIESTGMNGLVTLAGGTVTLNGGTAADQHSYIQTTAGIGPNPIAITSEALALNGSVMMGATNATAEILSSFGNIAITSSGPIELQGGSQTDTAARIAVSPGTNVDTIAIEMQGLTLNGGSAAGALAEITSPGGVISIDGTTNVMSGAIALTADAADAIIHTSGAPMGANAILIGQAMSRAPPTAITLQGGMTGTSSRAILSSDIGGDILSTSSGAYSITGGTGDIDSRAGFYTGLTSGSGGITLAGTSYSLTGGLSGMGYNSAEILSGIDGGAITLTSNGSDVTLLARGADTSDARIATQDGDAIIINTIGGFSATGGTGDSARAIVATDAGGNITVSGTGAYTITGGGSTGDSYAGIYSALSGGTGTINLSGTSYNLTGGSSTGTNRAEISTGGGSITIASSSGNSILQGGTGSTSDARIITNGAGNIDFTGVGNVSLLGGVGTSSVAEVSAQGILTATIGSGNYILTGGASGTADGSNAVIESTGMNGSVTLVGGDITLNGGTAVNQHSYIQTTAGSGMNPIDITCGALNLNGSGVSNGSAEVRTVLGDIDIAASSNITLTAGAASLAVALIQSATQGELTLNAQNFIVEAGATAGSSGVITQSGDISITCTQDASLSATVPNALAALQTFGSDLTMSVGGSINLVGASISTPAPVGNLLLIAGVDITIDGTTEVTALGTMASSLTFVVDNNFPTPPGIGPGAFILDAGGILSTEPGMSLKIYTAVRDQNTVNSPINSVPFVPGTLGVNTSTEEWDVYYPGGSYEGAAFKFYYKTAETPPPGPSPSPVNPRQFFDLIAANLVELAYLLPILDVNWKHYHFQLCKQDRRNIYCSPTFSPYGSFIFEDNVYWVGTGL